MLSCMCIIFCHLYFAGPNVADNFNTPSFCVFLLQKNHLSGLKRKYLKIQFDTVQQLMRVRSDLMHVVEKNEEERDAVDAFESIYGVKRYPALNGSCFAVPQLCFVSMGLILLCILSMFLCSMHILHLLLTYCLLI